MNDAFLLNCPSRPASLLHIALTGSIDGEGLLLESIEIDGEVGGDVTDGLCFDDSKGFCSGVGARLSSTAASEGGVGDGHGRCAAQQLWSLLSFGGRCPPESMSCWWPASPIKSGVSSKETHFSRGTPVSKGDITGEAERLPRLTAASLSLCCVCPALDSLPDEWPEGYPANGAGCREGSTLGWARLIETLLNGFGCPDERSIEGC